MLFDQDQADPTPGGMLSGENDDRRRHRVFEQLANGVIATPESKYHAAMILQHTPRKWMDDLLSSPGR